MPKDVISCGITIKFHPCQIMKLPKSRHSLPADSEIPHRHSDHYGHRHRGRGHQAQLSAIPGPKPVAQSKDMDDDEFLQSWLKQAQAQAHHPRSPRFLPPEENPEELLRQSYSRLDAGRQNETGDTERSAKRTRSFPGVVSASTDDDEQAEHHYGKRARRKTHGDKYDYKDDVAHQRNYNKDKKKIGGKQKLGKETRAVGQSHSPSYISRLKAQGSSNQRKP
ncbi:hypothetical protein B0H63DRAFT_50814 [Podospora didyma]|uniref:Uncharacterized protein n=1 Tax=Podospora didyma TaxID=330526 RepID=A0AAE0P728_9PEZI|nr:hypothetical protein B0H63DRAFT_50814 [Podospora didyma]